MTRELPTPDSAKQDALRRLQLAGVSPAEFAAVLVHQAACDAECLDDVFQVLFAGWNNDSLYALAEWAFAQRRADPTPHHDLVTIFQGGEAGHGHGGDVFIFGGAPNAGVGGPVLAGPQIGEILEWAAPPPQLHGALWLVCDGHEEAYADFPLLGAAIGDQYGGNGVTTFGLPNLTPNHWIFAGPRATRIDFHAAVS